MVNLRDRVPASMSAAVLYGVVAQSEHNASRGRGRLFFVGCQEVEMMWCMRNVHEGILLECLDSV